MQGARSIFDIAMKRGHWASGGSVMFWDRVAPLYDFFENTFNRGVYDGTGVAVAQLVGLEDEVLECACGTGAISTFLAPICKRLVATDFSEGMLKQARKKLAKYRNATVERADITCLHYEDASFDIVIAGNVIHLLPDPGAVMRELERVVRAGGTIVVPTYVKRWPSKQGIIPKILARLGVDFKEQFDVDSYRAFFEKLGYRNVTYILIDGRIPCVIASFTCNNEEQ